MTTSKPPLVFILSWERPLYTWMCLDSLYRHTPGGARFVIGDNASKDPQVREVIRGFERRGMFEAVHFFEDNDPMRLGKMAEMYWDDIGEYFAFIESDIAVFETRKGWLRTITDHMDRDRKIGSVGSRVHKDDFVSLEEAYALEPSMPDEAIADLIKLQAPMRHHRVGWKALVSPHNPPLRLLVLRKEAYAKTGFGRDVDIHKRMNANGWKSLISNEVVHRHLSLLNIYDYPDYDVDSRNAYFDFEDEGAGNPAKSNAILILGMHRSGTSCLAGSLQEAGLELGSVITQSPHNLKGNRENKAAMRLHEEVLVENGGSWSDPPANVQWSKQASEGLESLIASYPAGRAWGIKDPRMLLVLDKWRDALEKPRFVGTIRSPAKVVRSLQARNHEAMTQEAAYALYREYNSRLLDAWRMSPFPIVNFDWPADTYVRRVQEVASYLGLPRASEAGKGFFEEDLRDSGMLGEVPEQAAELHRQLAEIAEKPVSEYR